MGRSIASSEKVKKLMRILPEPIPMERAALDPILSFLNGSKKKRIAPIGMGGAGKAIWAFLNDRFEISQPSRF